MIRRYLLLAVAVCCMLACGRKETPVEDGARQRADRPRFTTEVLLKTTPVKDQGSSSLCWLYAMLATMETEHLMQGDSVNLSTDFVARHFVEEQALEASMGVRCGRSALTTRGTLPMALRLLQTYGLTHYDAYHPSSRADAPGGEGKGWGTVCRKLSQLISSPLTGLTDDSQRVSSFLDEVLGPLPRFVFMLGAEYTALEFAHSVCRADEYQAYTSFTHHPYYQAFPIEVPDNRYHSTFVNLPIDTLMAHIDRNLRSGHPVAWEGDVSEPGFRWKEGVAELDRMEGTRQQAFERGETTDDHCMEIVGIAHRVEGASKYYIMKNSWGTTNAFRGFILVNEDYVRMKTIAVVMRP